MRRFMPSLPTVVTTVYFGFLALGLVWLASTFGGSSIHEVTTVYHVVEGLHENVRCAVIPEYGVVLFCEGLGS